MSSVLGRFISARCYRHCEIRKVARTRMSRRLCTSTSRCHGDQTLAPYARRSLGSASGTRPMNHVHNSEKGKTQSCYHDDCSTSRQGETGYHQSNGVILKTKEELSINQFILSNSELSRDHLTPEIALHLMRPSCPLWSAPVEQSLAILEDNGIQDPFWAFYWPGGQVLTRYLLDNPCVVRGKAVLDVGSGCGASAIAAAMGGAKSVLANDIDRAAIHAIKLNAAQNHVNIATTSRNLIGGSDSQWDVVFLGDMFYDRGFTDTVTDWLRYLADNDTEVLIGDPGRLCLQEHPIKELLVNMFDVELLPRCKQENNGMTQGFVWTLSKSQK